MSLDFQPDGARLRTRSTILLHRQPSCNSRASDGRMNLPRKFPADQAHAPIGHHPRCSVTIHSEAGETGDLTLRFSRSHRRARVSMVRLIGQFASMQWFR
jgi:hypothetical protein